MTNRQRVLIALAGVFGAGAIRFYFLDRVEHHLLPDMASDFSAEYKRIHPEAARSDDRGQTSPTPVRTDVTRAGVVTFYRSDDLPTLVTKSRALIEQNDSDEARKLAAFLERLSKGDGQSEWIIMQPMGVDQSGALASQTHPCEINGVQHENCMDGATQIYVEGDVREIKDSPGGGAILTGKNGKCYGISPSELSTLRSRGPQIDDLLRPLGKQLETNPALSGTPSNTCDAIIEATKRYLSEAQQRYDAAHKQ